MHVIGIDEVGRGALAGPVVVAAVAVPKKLSTQVQGLPKLRDSKGLTTKQREEWLAYIEAHPDIYCASARVYPRVIERRNISWAANSAASKALTRLLRDFEIAYKDILLDGGLYLGDSRHADLPTKTIVKGDEKFDSIGLASIVAKVTRDRYMVRLGGVYPVYEFERHKGYGTSKHIANIRKYGVSPQHRLTFLQKALE